MCAGFGATAAMFFGVFITFVSTVLAYTGAKITQVFSKLRLATHPFDAQVANVGTIAAILDTIGVGLFAHFDAFGGAYLASFQTVKASFNAFF